MNILVLVKYSMDVSEVKVDPATHELRLAGVPEKIGNIDRNAVEAAVRLRDAAGGTLHALCLGPEAAKEAFKEILAMGVDEVTLVLDPFAGQADPGMAARILEAAIRKLGSFDLILTGFASDDGYTYQIGPRLAERLDLPLVSYVRRISVSDGALKADRDLDERLQTVTMPLPAVASIAEEAFPPRRTTLMDAIKAKKKPVHLWSVESDLGLSKAELESCRKYETLSQTGIYVQRKQQFLKGNSPQELADRVIDILLQEKVLKGGA